jgi:hypothetical protein
MTQTVKLNQLHDLLEQFDYPLSHETAVDTAAGVTLQLADGTEPLAEVIADSSLNQFDSAEDLESEVMMLLPRNAVGEPYQSEGDA